MHIFFRSLVLLLAFAGCSTSGDDQAFRTIRLGAIASLTGPAGEQGRNWLNGATLAVEELNREGIAVTLTVEDDETNPGKLSRAFAKLVEVDRVMAVIGGTWDYLADTAYPLAKRYRVPFITPTNPPEFIASMVSENPWIYSNGLSLRAERVAIHDAIKQLGAKRLMLVVPNVRFGTSHAELLQAVATDLGATVEQRYEFPIDGNYLEALRVSVLRVREISPDLVFLVADQAGLELFVAELSRLKLDPTLFTTQHLDQAFLQARDPTRYQKAFGVYPLLGEGSFAAAYQTRFGHLPRVYSAHGYDAVRFLVGAHRAGLGLGGASQEFTYDGVTGEHRLPSHNGVLVVDRAQVMTTRRGVFEAFQSPP